jgi:hypothetical protein
MFMSVKWGTWQNMYCVCVLDTYITRYQGTTKVTLESLHVSYWKNSNINLKSSVTSLLYSL